MCDLTVEVPEDLAATVGAEVVEMADDGLLTWDGRTIEVTERGRPFLRCVAALFDAYLNPVRDRHSVAV